MSAALENIKFFTPEKILDDFNKPENFTVDIFDIAESIGIKLLDVDFSDVEKKLNRPQDSILGAVIDTNDDLTVMLKKDLGNSVYYSKMSEEEKSTVLRRRKRFTLAHEIAHACIHLSQDDNKFKVDMRTELDMLTAESAYDEREYDANVFAGKLLIPEQKLQYIYKKLIYPSLDAMCNFFDVSHAVMEARLKFLNMSYIVD